MGKTREQINRVLQWRPPRIKGIKGVWRRLLGPVLWLVAAGTLCAHADLDERIADVSKQIEI